MHLFCWFSFEEKEKSGEKVFVMPCLSETKFRINNCPSCGAEVRNIQIPEDEFLKDLI